MDDLSSSERPAPSEPDSPSPRRAVRRRNAPTFWRDVFVPLAALALIAGAIVGIEAYRNSRSASDQPTFALSSDGFTPIKIGVTGSGKSAIGETAPAFQLVQPNGQIVKLADLRGTPVLLNFWATWCAPCRREIPDLVQLQREWGTSVTVVGVDLNEPGDVVSKYAAEMGMTYPLALDHSGAVTSSYQLTGLPETFFLDASGRIVDHRIGVLRPEVARCIVAGLEAGVHTPENCQ